MNFTQFFLFYKDLWKFFRQTLIKNVCGKVIATNKTILERNKSVDELTLKPAISIWLFNSKVIKINIDSVMIPTQASEIL